MWGRNFIFFIYIFLFRGKKRGGAVPIFYTHHRIPNKHMMTKITNNYEVIYVIKTVEISFKKNRYGFDPSSKYGSTFIC